MDVNQFRQVQKMMKQLDSGKAKRPSGFRDTRHPGSVPLHRDGKICYSR